METPPREVHYVLRLYNADRSAEMRAMAERIKAAILEICGKDCDIDVVDVLQEPERAAQQGVYLTPTLVRELPEPIRRVMGDLSEPGKTLALLGILTAQAPRST